MTWMIGPVLCSRIRILICLRTCFPRYGIPPNSTVSRGYCHSCSNNAVSDATTPDCIFVSASLAERLPAHEVVDLRRQFQSRWKFDKLVAADTARGRSFAKQQQDRPGLLLQGTAAVHDRRDCFRNHWSRIIQSRTEQPQEFMKRKQYDVFACANSVDLQTVGCTIASFLGMAAKQRDNRARREDGVVAGFVKALGPDGKVRLYCCILDVLKGNAPRPAHWHRVSVTHTEASTGLTTRRLQVNRSSCYDPQAGDEDVVVSSRAVQLFAPRVVAWV